ncbi:hypothetical protein HJFPF1_10353 [Paramyrothecium foliicola]|nr:hypothetical protein HJFPF1_10353 [Paramyrothecium foliicola]
MTTIFDIPGSNPQNPFSAQIQSVVTSSEAPVLVTATRIVNAVTTSSNPAHSLWQLWDAFFTAVATSTTSPSPFIALVNALRLQPPTQPSNVAPGSDAERELRSYVHADSSKLQWSELPRFSAQWRDVHDILEAWRDWDGVPVSKAENFPAHTPDKYYLRFCIFSAALLKELKGKGGVHPIRVFYASHDVLERERPTEEDPKAHRKPLNEVWALDVHIAAIWVRDGARALWDFDQEELRRHWAAALDEKTELWSKEDGMTRERWQLWLERLRALSMNQELEEETRSILNEAAEVVVRILGKGST